MPRANDRANWLILKAVFGIFVIRQNGNNGNICHLLSKIVKYLSKSGHPFIMPCWNPPVENSLKNKPLLSFHSTIRVFGLNFALFIFWRGIINNDSRDGVRVAVTFPGPISTPTDLRLREKQLVLTCHSEHK